MAREKKPKGPVRRVVSLTLKIFLLLTLLTVLTVLIIFYVKYGDDILQMQKDAKELVANSTEETFRQSETSLVYDSNGKILSVLKGEKDSYYIALDEIPLEVQDAMISTEDRKFYKHKGIDIEGIARAAYMLVKNKGITQGGSTITQQLVKIIFLTQEKTWERKIKEMFCALEMEKKYTKEQILEFYLNNIYFANGYYGIEAAAKGYFNKSCKELELSELVFLCAIPNNPSLYDPLINFDKTIEHRNLMLDQMLEEKKISNTQYSDAINGTIKLEQGKSVKQRNYVETYVQHCATEALMQNQGFQFRNTFKGEADQAAYEADYNAIYAECNASLYSGGYRIYTSINKKKQKLLQDAVDETLTNFTTKSEEGVYEFQGAATCIDNNTGRVVAIVGGRTQKKLGYTLNRAFQSYRQPGSSFKPIAVYAPALERGYTPDTIVVDEPLKGKDAPKNSNGTYKGVVTLRYALENSINTIAWKMFDELTPKTGLSYPLKMGFRNIVPTDYIPAASLGGLTNGTNTLEMAGAYTTLVNDGVYRQPTCIKKITDADGNLVVSGKREKVNVYKKNAARMMVDMMQGVLTKGTGRGLSLSNMPAGAKTGTTNDGKDGWFCGFTPYYTTCVWVGYDIPRTLEELYGATYPGTIWNVFMEQIHQGKEYKEFEEYEETESTKDEAKRPEKTEKPEKDDDFEQKEEEILDTPEPEPTDDWYVDPEPTDAPIDDTPTTPPDENITAEPEPTDSAGGEEGGGEEGGVSGEF